MKTFEDLPVWQAGRELVRRIYALTRRPPFRGDPGLCDQIQRAAVSVPSNLAEGHERGSTQDLVSSSSTPRAPPARSAPSSTTRRISATPVRGAARI